MTTVPSELTAKTSDLGNLPVSACDVFASDDVALIVGTCLPEAVFVVDEASGAIVAGNLKFLSLVGLELESLEREEYTCDQLVYPPDRAVFDAWKRSLLEGDESSFAIRIVRRNADMLPVSMQFKHLRWKRREYLVGFIREVSELEGRISELRRQLEEQKARAFDAIKSALRLYQFNEKIKRTPHLAKSLLNLESEGELFAEAAKVLTSEEGLGYKEATFLLVEENALRVAYSTTPEVCGAVYPLGDDHRFSRFIRNSFQQDENQDKTFLVPLQSRGQFLGVFEVTSYDKEKVFFDEAKVILEWQKDVLLDIGGILALLIDNIRLNREVKRQSIIDALTQTYNRHHFVSKLAAEVRRAKRYSRPCSLLFVDVDRFKEINDEYGHLQGDQVLRDLGKLFLQSVREVDVVCRYGGDEFLVLLPETTLEMARQTAEKLRARVQEHRFRHVDSPAVTVPVTVSMGVSALELDQTDEEFLQAADEALYRAKKAGRNVVACRSESSGPRPEDGAAAGPS